MTGRSYHALAVLTLAAVVGLGAVEPTGAAVSRSRPPVTASARWFSCRGPAGAWSTAPPRRGCTRVRALRGPAPFLGSQAVAISPDGRNVYVAASSSNAIAVFTRNASTGRLTQASGAPPGASPSGGAGGCAAAVGLDGPNSVAVSADGRNVYATSFGEQLGRYLRRNPVHRRTHARPPDGAVASPSRGDPGLRDGARARRTRRRGRQPRRRERLRGLVRGQRGRRVHPRTLHRCAGAAGRHQRLHRRGRRRDGCTTALALGALEGMAVSGDGNNVYVAAALSSALDVLTRNPSTGALTQADRRHRLHRRRRARRLHHRRPARRRGRGRGQPRRRRASTSRRPQQQRDHFTRTPTTGQLAQPTGTSACAIYVLAVGCSLGRALSAPEGLGGLARRRERVRRPRSSPASIDVFNRNGDSGALIAEAASTGLHDRPLRRRTARPRAALRGASSVAVSPDGKNVYSAAFASNAVAVFKRVTEARRPGRMT